MLSWITIFYSPLLFSQQEASFSQYMFNQQLINPAYVGAQSFTQLSILNHSQWLNIEGAPETQALSVGTKLSKKIGIGFSAFNDRIGPARNTSSSIDFAYHLKLNENNLKLGLGLKMSGRLNSLDLSGISTVQSGDNLFSFQSQNELNLNFGAGFYIYSPNFYLGMGVPFLLEEDTFNIQRNFYVITGGIFRLSETIQLKPSFLIQKTADIGTIYDNSVWLVFNNRFWIGPQYRASLKNAIPSRKAGGYFGAIAGIYISKSLSLGYAYQGAIGNQSLGITNTSHEIMLRFQFLSKYRGILRSPRLF
jgi:type IX secretion system PorP/SprF family membrane protein